MTMTIEDAHKIERPPIVVGQQYTFYSTMQQEHEPPEQRIRNYTGKLVTVIRWTNEDEWLAEQTLIAQEIADGADANEVAREVEPMFLVRASNGFEFDAWQGELNGWFCDTGQFFWPNATWGPKHDTFALSNELES